MIRLSKWAISLIFATSASINAAEFAVAPDQSVSLLQIDFPDSDNPVLDSSVGMLQANLIALRFESGIDSGYLNVVIDGDWVVRNMAVLPDTEYPYSHLSTRFDLGINEGTDVISIDAAIIFSDEAFESAPSGTSSTFTVGSLTYSSSGVGNDDGTRGARGDPVPPTLNDVLFTDPTNTRAIFQLDHPNLEAADNQCYPMAIANSLQFLANTTDFSLPHSHVVGLKGDQSLVGQIAQQMNRIVTDRRNGRPVKDDVGIQGKLKYLAANGLQDQVQTRHWGRYASTSNLSETVNGKTATSTAMGQALNFEMMVTALEGGENCEAGYSYSTGGGHMIDIVAAGYTRGQPWIIEASDVDQSSDSMGSGPEGLIFSHLKDSDNDGDFNLNGGGTELDLMICQKYVPPKMSTGTLIPPPETEFLIPGLDLDITGTSDPAGHSCCADAPPASVGLTASGNQLIFADGFESGATTSWMPITASINDQGQISGSNTATVAGFSNINNSITGVIMEDRISAEISLGTQGGLPQSQPISWEVDIMAPDEGWPWAVKDTPAERTASVRVNGFRNSHTISSTDPFSLGIGVNPGDQENPAEVEWWVVVQAGDLVLSFDAANSTWTEGLFATTSGPVEAIGNESIFNLPQGGVPPGNYTFYFGIDDVVNNEVDASLDFDLIELVVE